MLFVRKAAEIALRVRLDRDRDYLFIGFRLVILLTFVGQYAHPEPGPQKLTERFLSAKIAKKINGYWVIGRAL